MFDIYGEFDSAEEINARADELLNAVLEAGLYAASGMNTQGVRLVAVRDRATRDLLSRLNAAVMGTDRDPFYGAPCVVVVLADPEIYGGWVEDGALALGTGLLVGGNVGHVGGGGAFDGHHTAGGHPLGGNGSAAGADLFGHHKGEISIIGQILLEQLQHDGAADAVINGLGLEHPVTKLFTLGVEGDLVAQLHQFLSLRFIFANLILPK